MAIFLCKNSSQIQSKNNVEKKKKMPFSIVSLDSTKFQAKKVLDHKRVKKNRVNTIDKLRASQWAHFLNILSAHQFTT